MKDDKRAKELSKIVEEFNNKYSIGDKIAITVNDEPKYLTVKSKAIVLHGHSAVAWFNEIVGCYSIEELYF